MALPPSSIMRARLLANSSISTEVPLVGSAGALTLLPHVVVPADALRWPPDVRWRLTVTPARRPLCASAWPPELRQVRLTFLGDLAFRRPCFGHISRLLVMVCKCMNGQHFHCSRACGS